MDTKSPNQQKLSIANYNPAGVQLRKRKKGYAQCAPSGIKGG